MDIIKNYIRNKIDQQVCGERIEEDYRRNEEEIKSQMQFPTEVEQLKAIAELAIYNPYHDLKMIPHEHIPRDQQPFYTKFLNKRNKRNKRK